MALRHAQAGWRLALVARRTEVVAAWRDFLPGHIVLPAFGTTGDGILTGLLLMSLSGADAGSPNTTCSVQLAPPARLPPVAQVLDGSIR